MVNVVLQQNMMAADKRRFAPIRFHACLEYTLFMRHLSASPHQMLTGMLAPMQSQLGMAG
jgi:hypothetical protein